MFICFLQFEYLESHTQNAVNCALCRSSGDSLSFIKNFKSYTIIHIWFQLIIAEKRMTLIF